MRLPTEAEMNTWPDWKKFLLATGVLFGLLLVLEGLDELAKFLLTRESWEWVFLGFFVWVIALVYAIVFVWNLLKLAWELLRDGWRDLKKRREDWNG